MTWLQLLPLILGRRRGLAPRDRSEKEKSNILGMITSRKFNPGKVKGSVIALKKTGELLNYS